MKHLIPLLALLGACSTPPPDADQISRELAAFRESLEELKKNQPTKGESDLAMDDLAREIRRLRDRLAQPPSPAAAVVGMPALPSVHAELLSGSPGGTQPSVNDLYWVLAKMTVGGEERLVLALYQAASAGRGFKLAGVRILGPDLQIIDYGQEKPHVREIIEELKKAQK